MGDAVTNHIAEIARRLSQWGIPSAIYGADISSSPIPQAQLDQQYADFLDNPDDILLYHYSAYCENYLLYRRSRNRKVLIYHNITPAEFFHPYDTVYESLCRRGRQTLQELTECDLAVGVSEYNRQELIAACFAAERTGVLPLFLSTETWERTPRQERLYRQLKADGVANILFVGKVAPNKRFEDLIKIFAAYHRHANPRSRLIVAGARFLPRYDQALDGLVARLGLQDAVLFTNRVPLADLKACYEAADLFLCASQHEGFCVPLLEAMYFDVPILARGVTGVPYTLGEAGVQFHQVSYPVLAEVMDVLIGDQVVRAQVIASQRARLRAFDSARVEDSLRAVLQTVGALPASPAAIDEGR
jgi:glycosyltransferase involved in cell wall biosynthesis